MGLDNVRQPAVEGSCVRQVNRRTLLGAAASLASGAAVAGCVSPKRLLTVVGVKTRLTIMLVGFTHDVATALGTRLQQCASAYNHTGRGQIDLQVSDTLVPDAQWYAPCTPATAACPAHGDPATAVGSLATATQLTSANQGAQLWNSDGVSAFAVRGRTRLGVRFGDGTVAPPVASQSGPPGGDILIAYDLWQYWLAPLAMDITAGWKTTPDDRQGLPADIDRFGTFFSLAKGPFMSAFPLLRNPMLIQRIDAIGGLSSSEPWQWIDFVDRVRQHPGVQVTDFIQSDLRPEATECACSVVAAYGGRVGNATVGTCTPVFDETSAVSGITQLASLVAERAQDTGAGVTTPMRPMYLWDVLWSNRIPCWTCSGKMAPLPSGPKGPAVPCTYVGASVLATSPNPSPAMAFCSFLMSSGAQSILSAWQGGLALRADQAMKQLMIRPTYGAISMPQAVVSSAHDLTCADLLGGQVTQQNWMASGRTADAFATGVGKAEQAPVNPSNVAFALGQAAKNPPSV